MLEPNRITPPTSPRWMRPRRLAVGVVPRLRAFYFRQDTVPVERAAAVLAPMPTQLAVGASPPESTSKTQGRRPLLPDAEGRIRVRVSDRMPPRFPAEGIPAGWTAKEFVGHASVELVRDEARLALRLRSAVSAAALVMMLAKMRPSSQKRAHPARTRSNLFNEGVMPANKRLPIIGNW